MTSDLISPSPVRLIDVEQLMTDSEMDANRKLLKAGFTVREIQVCVRRKPVGQYLAYVEQDHPLIFDDNFRFDTAMLQHVHNVRRWLKDASKPADEWVSHGYALAWMNYKSGRPDLDRAIISAEMSNRSRGRSRKRKPIVKMGIEAVLSLADVDLCDFGMSTFREYVGLDRKVPVPDGHIYMSAIQDGSNVVSHYVFEYRSDDESVLIEEKCTTGAIRTRISKIKNSK